MNNVFSVWILNGPVCLTPPAFELRLRGINLSGVSKTLGASAACRYRQTQPEVNSEKQENTNK